MIVDIVIPARNPDAGLAGRINALARMCESTRIGAIVIVDDGSHQPLDAMQLGLLSVIPLRLVRLEGTGNRSIARNAGARHSTGTHLYFVDSDCAPADLGVLSKLSIAFNTVGVIAAGGPVRGVGEGFWHRYQKSVVATRRGRGGAFALTSANLLVERAAFDAVGGFDEGYTAYGFEDRDLIFRLARSGTVVYQPDAVIEHRDSLSMAAVSQKMFSAGQGSSARFRSGHPEAYSRLGYARIDVATQPWLRPLASLAGPLAMRLSPGIDRLIARRPPFWTMRALVKVTGALAFLYGTSRRRSDA